MNEKGTTLSQTLDPPRGDLVPTSTKSKCSLKIPDFIIGESLIFNQLCRPTRTKASDNGGPSLAAIPSADGKVLYTTVLAMMSDARISGWLLRFFIFGVRNSNQHILCREMETIGALSVEFRRQCSDFDRTKIQNASIDVLISDLPSFSLASVQWLSQSSPLYHIMVG